jgi:BirA family biotin operon repressor/biotin-[acetyl-CoA-carboxylase] ligase
VKWPNDVVATNGRKLAGLLVETSLEDGRLADAVIGTGINVNWRRVEMPADVAVRATSLLELGGTVVDRVALLARLLDALEAEVAALERGESPVARLAAVSALDGRRVIVELGAERVVGRAAGISEEGLLLLDTELGRVALAIGEVTSVGAPEVVGAEA